MSLYEWLTLVTSWVAIGVSIWSVLHDSDSGGRHRRK